MKTIDLFPSPVFGVSYPHHDILKNQIFDLISEVNTNVFERNEFSSHLFHYKNTIKDSILYQDLFKDFKNWVEEQCYYYVTEILGYHLEDKIIVTDSWLNKMNKGGHQYSHYHGNCYVSGTYYIHFDPKGHAPLVFQNPETATTSFRPSLSLDRGKIPTPYNSDSIITPEESELYLWKSHMNHAVVDNQMNNRITLSMNFMPSIFSNERYGFKVSSLNY